jgi:hypothetical protein
MKYTKLSAKVSSILFLTLSLLCHFAFSQENDELMPKGMWKDPATGLIWDRCSAGQAWNGLTCTGKALAVGWEQAKKTATARTTGGYDDWQLPSVAELETLIKCSNGFSLKTRQILPHQGASVTISDECQPGSSSPTIDLSIFPGTMPNDYWTGSLPKDPNDDPKWAPKVRFFYPNDYGSTVNFVRAVRKNSIGNVIAIETLLSSRLKTVQENARLTEIARKNKAAEESIAFEKRVAAFRKSVQEGDDTSQGLVVQIKGSLVKIQTNDSQCSQRNYKGDCTNYINTPVEKWVKRSEIYPK